MALAYISQNFISFIIWLSVVFPCCIRFMHIKKFFFANKRIIQKEREKKNKKKIRLSFDVSDILDVL